MATLWLQYGYTMGRVWVHLAKSLTAPWELLAKRESKLSTQNSREPGNCQPKPAEKPVLYLRRSVGERPSHNFFEGQTETSRRYNEIWKIGIL